MLAISYFLHLVATVTWIGGLLLLVVVVWPAARNTLAAQDENGTLLRMADQLRKRFMPLTNLSLIVLVVTGLIQMAANPHYDGFLKVENDWARAILIKHIAIVGMVIIGAVQQISLAPSLERATLMKRKGKDAPDLLRLEQRERQLTALNLLLGVLVLLFTAIATAA